MIDNIFYPSKTFLQDARQPLFAWDDFVINILPNWRKRIIEKEIDRWATSTQHIEEMVKNKNKYKYFICSMMACTQLMTIHHLAIGNGYVMSYKKNGDLKICYKYCPTSNLVNQSPCPDGSSPTETASTATTP